VAELIKRPEVLTSVQATLSRVCDLDSLLSVCAIVPKTETLHVVEQRINQVIGLKHALELLPNLHTSLSADLESDVLVQIKTVLSDENFPVMLEQVKGVIIDEARVAKGGAAMRLQRCFAVKTGLNGLLDVARRTYCELVDDIENRVRKLSEKHGMPMRVGFTALRGRVSIFIKKKNFLKIQ
jgi:DNA mismatch repair protein MSH4